MTGLIWLYKVATEEGVERMSFLNISSRSLILGLFLIMVEIIVMPIFSIVIFLLYFDSAWKPFLIEALGVAMCATGILLILR